MLLVILGWLVVAFCVWAVVYGTIKDEEGWQIAGWVVGVCLGLTVIITTLGVPLANQGRLQEMYAFQDANARNYQVAATKTELILSEQQFIVQALIPVEGSIEKMDVGTGAVERLLEWRNEVVRYNNDLARFRYFDKHLWVGFYFPNPSGLKFIVIE